MSRSAAAKRAWVTMRSPEWQEKQILKRAEADARAKRLSEIAHKAVATRRANADARAKRLSEIANKAVATRKANARKAKRSAAANKAWATRKANEQKLDQLRIDLDGCTCTWCQSLKQPLRNY